MSGEVSLRGNVSGECVGGRGVCMHVFDAVYVCVHVYECMCVCVRACVCVVCMCVCMLARSQLGLSLKKFSSRERGP